MRELRPIQDLPRLQLNKVAAAALGIVLTVGLVACTMGDQADGPPELAQKPDPTRAATARMPMACADVTIECHYLPGDQLVIRYPTKNQPSQGLLLWDDGGPGNEPVDAGVARLALPDWTKAYDLLVVAEPWTYRPVADACLRDAEAGGVTGRTPTEAADGCDWESLNFTQDEYQSLLKAATDWAGPIDGIYASSFGAPRTTAAYGLLPENGFVVLDSPAPTPGTSATRLLGARSQVAKRIILKESKCPSVPGCFEDRDDRYDRLVDGEAGVSSRDGQLAMLGIAYDIRENSDFLSAFWRKDLPLDRLTSSEIVSASRGFNLSTGSGAATSRLVGYLAQICPMYRNWPTETVANALESMHAICGTDRFEDGGYSVPRDPGVPILVAVNLTDPVVPETFQVRWERPHPDGLRLTYTYPGHTTLPDALNDKLANWPPIAASG